jgi:hypothetical protein
MKKYLKTILPLISLTALILSACNAPATATPTEAVSAIYTAAAQTIVAQAAKATATPKPTGTTTATQTPLATATQPVSSVPTLPVSQPACDKSVYISDVTFPDNTVVAPGQVFDKTWALMNTGTCAWTTAYSMTFVSGEKMGGGSTLLTQAVPSQQQANIIAKLTAPTTAGTYTGWWQLANPQGTKFGQQVSVVIVVSGSGTTTVTATPRTATVTATQGAATATPGTPTATNPPVNTVTPTPTTAVAPTETGTPTLTVPPGS